jgi:hypothetical protein
MKNRGQNVMRSSSRILSIVLLFVGMLAVSPQHAPAQTAQVKTEQEPKALEEVEKAAKEDALPADSGTFSPAIQDLQRCNRIRTQIMALADELVEMGENRESLIRSIAKDDKLTKDFPDIDKGFPGDRERRIRERNFNIRELDSTNARIKEIKKDIDDLLKELPAVCCACKDARTFSPTTQNSQRCERIKREIAVRADILADLGGQRLRVRFETYAGVPDAGRRLDEVQRKISRFKEEINELLKELLATCCPCKEEIRTTDEPPDVPGLEDSPSTPQPKTPVKKLVITPFKRNQAAGLFSIIREDSTPRFNTYGFNGAYTYFLNPSVGLAIDFNAHFRQQNGTDLSKIGVLGGLTFVPFVGAKTTDKATLSLHALGGISHFKAKNAISTFTDDAFYMKLGGALDINVTNNFFIRPIQFDYAPTFFGNSTQHNIQFGFGAGVRF